MEKFLEKTKYIDFEEPVIEAKANELFKERMTDIEKTKTAYEFVRDEIPHTFDTMHLPSEEKLVFTFKASDVLKFRTGICHAKSNLLAAFLRREGIPAGFCFQHLTLRRNSKSYGYCLHCFNAVYLNGKWIKLDTRGNTNGVNAQFSMESPILAFKNRSEYFEYFFNGIFSQPDPVTMNLLETAPSLSYILNNLTECPSIEPDINE